MHGGRRPKSLIIHQAPLSISPQLKPGVGGDGCSAWLVRTGLPAGGHRIRTFGPAETNAVPNATPLSAPTARIGEHVLNGQEALGRVAGIRPQLVVSAVSHRPPRLRPAVEIVLALTNIETASACSADRIKSASASSQSEMGL